MTATITDLGRVPRQAELVPREQLAATAASVIGVGAIGRQVAIQLAAIGVRQLQLVDFDTVELTNITSQGYWQDDLGQAKATATAAALQKIDPTIEVDAICDRYRPRIPLCGAVFCCVDAIATRAAIWRIARLHPVLGGWPDARRSDSRVGRRRLSGAGVLWHDAISTGDAQRGSCTARSTVYAANIAAGLMVHQFTRYSAARCRSIAICRSIYWPANGRCSERWRPSISLTKKSWAARRGGPGLDFFRYSNAPQKPSNQVPVAVVLEIAMKFADFNRVELLRRVLRPPAPDYRRLRGPQECLSGRR